MQRYYEKEVQKNSLPSFRLSRVGAVVGCVVEVDDGDTHPLFIFFLLHFPKTADGCRMTTVGIHEDFRNDMKIICKVTIT